MTWVDTPDQSDDRDARLVRFLESWRKRLLARHVEDLTGEEFGQLLTLNTVLAYLENTRKP